jgi:esterase/lipase superfamily enzyme
MRIGSRSCCTLLLLTLAVGVVTVGCARQKLSRRLMPTPLGIAVGLPYPGEALHQSCDCVGDEVPVFIVSGRNIEEEKEGPDPFGSERSCFPTLGIAYVKIGEGMSRSELYEETTSNRKEKKATVKFERIELSPTLDKLDHWLVKDGEVRHGDNLWVQAVRAQLDHSTHRRVTIFVHGYNTTLIDNTLLAAEIHHYLGREGAVISFEWPSESSLFGYIADKGNADYSTRHFRALISNIAKECQVDSITIIAHSAGSPIVVNALREIRLMEYDMTAEQIQQKYRIKSVVLAAPDMDLMEFNNGIYDRFYEVADRVAVYASPDDQALRISEKLNGNKRLGRAVGRLKSWEKETLQQVPQIEMIDASVADNEYHNFLGHSYFHRDPWVSSDIGAFILGSDPQKRNLVRREGEVFWRFPNDYPGRLQQKASLLGSSPVLNEDSKLSVSPMAAAVYSLVE